MCNVLLLQNFSTSLAHARLPAGQLCIGLSPGCSSATLFASANGEGWTELEETNFKKLKVGNTEQSVNFRTFEKSFHAKQSYTAGWFPFQYILIVLPIIIKHLITDHQTIHIVLKATQNWIFYFFEKVHAKLNLHSQSKRDSLTIQLVLFNIFEHILTFSWIRP